VLAALLAGACLFTLTGCGGSKSAKKSTTPTATSSAAAASSSTSTDSPEVAAVKKAYTDFLDPAVPVAQKTALIQDGTAFLPTMQQQAGSQFAKSVSIKIQSVKLDSPNTASLLFDLLLTGSPVLTNQTGYAIKENGSWKVAGTTFCGLLSAQGPVPSVCMTAAGTALPS
jgi:hypothetical protein